MTVSKDPFTDWDAAYLLGALSPSDRHAYEDHLAECDACSASVSELAGVPGLLARVPAGSVEELLSDTPQVEASSPTNENSLVALLDKARARRRRSRRWTLGLTLAAVAAAALIALVIPNLVSAVGTPPATAEVSMSQVVPTALSAHVRLVSEPWGTRIESTCLYRHEAQGASSYSASGTGTYAMVVTDRSGATTQVSTWQAWPGSTVNATATTHLDVDDIASVAITSLSSGQTLLKSTFAAGS
jgi:hypothetical protein